MTATSPPSTTNTHPTAPGWRIRGNVFVVPFLVVLLILLVLTLSIAFQFQTIMQRLDQSRGAWPAASADLASRYATVDALIAAEPERCSPTQAIAWKNEYLAFRETTQYDRQSRHAVQLESIIAAESLAPDLRTTDAIDRLLDSERQRIEAQSSTIGQWTIVGLRLKLPETFYEGT